MAAVFLSLAFVLLIFEPASAGLPLCSPGNFNPDTGTEPCTPCAAGTFQTDSGATACNDCLPGSFQDTPGRSICESCPEGRFSPLPRAEDCLLCDIGKFQDAPGRSTCDNCERGTFQDSPGQTTCRNCDPGTFQAQTGGTTCNECSPGRFQSDPGESTCISCTPGTFSAESSATTCENCGPGTFGDVSEAALCTPCPSGTAQADTQSTDCIACPEGTALSTGHETCGGCGLPVSVSGSPRATDALFVLRASVGSENCDACVCDAEGSGTTTALDALVVLSNALGLGTSLACPSCRTSALITAAGGTLVSGDGLLTVDFPPGAVADDTLVSVAGVVPASFTPGADAPAYALEPDGLSLAAPAVASLELADSPAQLDGSFSQNVAVLFSTDGGEIEAANPADLAWNYDTGQSIAGGELSRLGLVSAAEVPGFSAQVSGVPATAFVGLAVTAVDATVVQGRGCGTPACAHYTDDGFGAFQPTEGTALVDEEMADGGGSYNGFFVYDCASAAMDTFDAGISIEYPTADLINDTFGSAASTTPGETSVRISLEKQTVCQEPPISALP